jgi:hypothetical protein
MNDQTVVLQELRIPAGTIVTMNGIPVELVAPTVVLTNPSNFSLALSELGRKGGESGTGEAKRRDVDYAAMGRIGGLKAQAKRKKR